MLKLILWMAVIVGAGALELIEENYAEKVHGKTVFIGYFVEYCVWCKDMKPAWNELMSIYKDNQEILIAEINCGNSKSGELCEKHKIEYLPTLRYGNPLYLDDYEGARDIKSLTTFANMLKKFCSPDNLKDCDEKSKENIKKFQTFSDTDLQIAIEGKEKIIKKIKDEFHGKVRKLEKEIEKLRKKEEESVNWINEKTGLGAFISVDPEKPECSPMDQENCDEKTKANIKKVMAMSPQELKDASSKKTKVIEEAKKHFDNEVERLEFTKFYTEYQREKSFEIQKVNDDGLSAMRIIARYRKSKGGEAQHDEL